MEKILDFVVNPDFCDRDNLQMLKHKGFPAHYMNDEQKNPKVVWTIVLEQEV